MARRYQILGGILAFVAVGLAAKLSDGGGMPDSLPVAAVAVGLLLVFGVLVLVKRLRGE